MGGKIVRERGIGCLALCRQIYVDEYHRSLFQTSSTLYRKKHAFFFLRFINDNI